MAAPAGPVAAPAEAPPVRRGRLLSAEEGRSLLLEMVSVIAGVLIALLVDQLADDWREQRRVTEFRQILREEMRFNTGWYAYRVAVAPCVERIIDRLDSHVEALAAKRPVAPLDMPVITLGGRLDDQAWNALQASGSLPKFPLAEQKMLSGVYSQQNDIREWQASEGEDWVVLSLVNKPPATLTPADISQLRLAIASEWRWAALFKRNSERQIERARQLQIARPDFAEERQAGLARRSTTICAAVGLTPAWPKGYGPLPEAPGAAG